MQLDSILSCVHAFILNLSYKPRCLTRDRTIILIAFGSLFLLFFLKLHCKLNKKVNLFYMRSNFLWSDAHLLFYSIADKLTIEGENVHV